eukprot:403332326
MEELQNTNKQSEIVQSINEDQALQQNINIQVPFELSHQDLKSSQQNNNNIISVNNNKTQKNQNKKAKVTKYIPNNNNRVFKVEDILGKDYKSKPFVPFSFEEFSPMIQSQQSQEQLNEGNQVQENNDFQDFQGQNSQQIDEILQQEINQQLNQAQKSQRNDVKESFQQNQLQKNSTNNSYFKYLRRDPQIQNINSVPIRLEGNQNINEQIQATSKLSLKDFLKQGSKIEGHNFGKQVTRITKVT